MAVALKEAGSTVRLMGGNAKMIGKINGLDAADYFLPKKGITYRSNP